MGMKSKRRGRAAKSEAWGAAEFAYSGLVAQSMVPLLSRKLSRPEEIDELEQIARTWPEYYPARFHLGSLQVASGRESEGRRHLFGAVEQLAQDESPGTMKPEELDNVIEFLEQELRYDVVRDLAAKLIEAYPQTAAFYDACAAAVLRLGDVGSAVEMFTRALELDPDNSHYLCNLGWAHLGGGQLDEAEKALERSLALKPNDEVTLGNVQVLRFLRQEGGTYRDYLLRPLDLNELHRLEDQAEETEKFDELDRFAGEYNLARLEAWRGALCRKADLPRYSEVFKSLRAFFTFIEKQSQDMYELYEDLDRMESRFDLIMNKFIVRMSDADAEVIEELYTALFSFYGFLAEHGLVGKKAYRQFRSQLRGKKKAVLEKATRYAAIRHDESVSDEEKEEVREELFGDAHWWPGL